jgi:cob(I)alamin adenosyltransferase
VRVYTKTGDDGTTGLLYGGRAAKDSAPIQLAGTVDEAQAAIGLARAEADPGSELDDGLTRIERELYVLMAEVVTDPANRGKLVDGTTSVSEDMVSRLESEIDDLLGRFEMPADFVVPGANRASAALDLARTVVRRAERLYVAGPLAGSRVGRYLNRLSDLLWAWARAAEGDVHLLARGERRRRGDAGASDVAGGSGS